MFETPRNVKAVTIVMRSSRPQWISPLIASGIRCCGLACACMNCCPLVCCCCLSLLASGSRTPQSWGYFAINSAALIAQPGPFMLLRCGGILLISVL